MRAAEDSDPPAPTQPDLEQSRAFQLVGRQASHGYLQHSMQVILLAVAAVFLALHYVHLTADFPNHSPWMDWSKYTDEGWYGDAAIRHFQLGHWYVPGDFNPAAALPGLPLLEALVFGFTGVSLIAVRALTVTVFGGILFCSWLLVRRYSAVASLAPAVSVLLLAVSPFCFVFTRLAIIEPLLILTMLLTLFAAGSSSGTRAGRIRIIAALGILLPAMVLTKTTALFLFPAPAWLLFAANRYRWRAFLAVALPSAGLGLALWLVYFLGVVRPHYLIDYRYLFSANAYTGITRANAFSVIRDTFVDGTWMGGPIWMLALAAAAVALANFHQMREYPLIPALILWAGGYCAFLAYHNNLQPRYYLVVAVPVTLLVPYFADQFLPGLVHRRGLKTALALVSGSIVAAIALPDALATISYVRHPEYTLVRAAEDVVHFIEADRKTDPAHNLLVLSISGSDLSLMTGLPSICDDFGTLQLIDRVKRYRPGWYVAWNAIEDDKMEALAPVFHVVRVATFPAMDDPDRNQLILYRLDALPAAPTTEKPASKRSRNKIGQQPSAGQREH
jgi:hypothetical protein